MSSAEVVGIVVSVLGILVGIVAWRWPKKDPGPSEFEGELPSEKDETRLVEFLETHTDELVKLDLLIDTRDHPIRYSGARIPLYHPPAGAVPPESQQHELIFLELPTGDGKQPAIHQQKGYGSRVLGYFYVEPHTEVQMGVIHRFATWRERPV